MNLLARTPKAVVLAERLLITRIITSVGLALLLVLGAWISTHAEPELAPPVSSAVTETVDSHIAATALDATSIEQSAAVPAMWGVAVCVLGVLCGMLLVVLTRWLHRARRTQPDQRLLPLIRALLPAALPPRPSAFSPTQLGISRT